MDGGLEAAKVLTRDGQHIVVVAVRSDMLSDDKRTQAALDVLSSVFPGQYVVLAASTSDGVRYVSRAPEVAEKIRRKRAPLTWQRYSFA